MIEINPLITLNMAEIMLACRRRGSKSEPSIGSRAWLVRELAQILTALVPSHFHCQPFPSRNIDGIYID